MRLVIIGGVAAGTSVATKARRNNEDLDIVLYDRDTDISYSGCGLPYYIGETVDDIDDLVPRDAQFFKEKHNIDVLTSHEVLSIDKDQKTVKVKNLKTEVEFTDDYDVLVIATGASSFVPPIEGADKKHVFSLRNVNDARQIKDYIDQSQPQKAVVVGSGFIGLEMIENLHQLNLEITLVELQPKLTSNLDEDMAHMVESKLIEKGVHVIKGASVDQIFDHEVLLSTQNKLEADLVILATGVRPNTKLAESIGVELGVTKAIVVDEKMRTNVDSVYACGDCIETYNFITKQPHYRPLGTTANKTGRICGDVITGGENEYHGNLGTGIYKVFDLTVGSSGIGETEAKELGYDIEVIHNTKMDKAPYFGGKKMTIKAIADKSTQTLLGVQIVGYQGVDKRLDVLVTLMTYRVPVSDFFHIDLAYAPPFSTTKDPVHYTGMILDNIFSEKRPVMTNDCLCEKQVVIDVRSESDVNKKGMVDRAIHIPLSKLREACAQFDENQEIVVYCNSGTSGNAAQGILLNKGFKKVKNLSGGHDFYVNCKNK